MTKEVLVGTRKRGSRKLTGQKLAWFLEFWDSYGYKAGKKNAIDSWIDIPNMNEVLFKEILHGAKCECRKREKQSWTPLMAQGFLTQDRWEDYEDTVIRPNPLLTCKKKDNCYGGRGSSGGCAWRCNKSWCSKWKE